MPAVRRCWSIRKEKITAAIAAPRCSRRTVLNSAKWPEAGAPHIPAQAREVFDVSGAGDTVIATLGALLGARADLATAVRIANQAAGIVVGKLGTAVVHPDELV